MKALRIDVGARRAADVGVAVVDHVLKVLPRPRDEVGEDQQVVVDRVVIRPSIKDRIADSIETALELSDGLLITENADDKQRHTFSEKFACPVSGFTIEEIEPRLFSFNNPFGACPVCDGLGTKSYFDPDLIIPNHQLSLKSGAISPWAFSSSRYYLQTLESLCLHYKVSINSPFGELPESFQNILINGSGGENVEMVYDDGLRQYKTNKPFEGVLPNLQRRYQETPRQH